MQSIISKGKDIEDAINIGLILLKVQYEDVDIEIIRQESKGFLGIGSRSAVVKLSVSPEKEESMVDLFDKAVSDIEGIAENRVIDKAGNNDEIKSVSQNELEGKGWVKDGHLYCMGSPDFYPTATIREGLKLLQNGEWIKESTVVLSENAMYEIITTDEEKPTSWQVTIDQHKLKVTLSVEPGYKMRRHVADIEPDAHITLKAEEIKEVHNTLLYEDVMKRLETLRVKQGFNQDNILKAIQSTEPVEYEIATGLPAKKGKDGWIEAKVSTDIKQEYQEDEFGNVNFKEIFTIPSVERGQVIAVIHPPIPGKPGLTVTNEPLPPEQTFPIELKLGKGVMLVDDKLVATESGRPKIKQRGRLVNIAILPKLVHRGDVDLQSGNLHFNGDIEIYGDVKEHMEVEADGDILVHSTVSFATLTSKGAISTLKNVVSSELSAGKNNMLITECGHVLGILQQQIELMNVFIRNLLESPAFKQTDIGQQGLQPLIKLLLEKRFKSVLPLSKQYVDVVLKGKDYFNSDEWRDVAITLKQIFLSLSNEIITFDRIKELSEKMRMLHEWSQLPTEPESYIAIPSALNSKLYSSGDVLILGQCSVNTKIHAGGMLKANGIVRGGELYAKLGIEANEVGSEMGTPTVLAVPIDQTIQIKKAMNGTVIRFANLMHTYHETRYNVYAYVNKEGQIAFN